MKSPKTVAKEREVGGISPKALKEAVRAFKESKTRLREYRARDIYHIEAWQKVICIPGGTHLHRCHYIYDSCGEKAFLKDHWGKIELVTDKKKIKELRDFVHHPIKAMKNGVFVRKLAVVEHFGPLYSLICLMEGHKVVAQRFRESEKRYRAKEKEYLKMIFNQIIDVK